MFIVILYMRNEQEELYGAGCILDLLLVNFLRVSVLAKLSTINCVEEYFFSFRGFENRQAILSF